MRKLIFLKKGKRENGKENEDSNAASSILLKLFSEKK